MRRSLIVVLAATLASVLLVGWFAPRMIAWYFSPPVEIGVSCKPAVEWGIAVYRKTLVLGAAGGFGLGVLAAAVWGLKSGPAKPA